MVKPIPVSQHTAHAFHDPQQPIELDNVQGKQIEQAVERPDESLSARLQTSTDTPLEQALAQLNETMKPWATGIQFEIDPELDRMVIAIVDQDSGEVLRTIPSEVLLQVAKMIASFQGQGIDIKV